MEMRRIELRASHMRSEHSTSELHPRVVNEIVPKYRYTWPVRIYLFTYSVMLVVFGMLLLFFF